MFNAPQNGGSRRAYRAYLLVAELAFTGSVNDQRGYLKTMRDLNRFFGKNKRLSNLTTISTNDYDPPPTGVKIIAVDILRDAFLQGLIVKGRPRRQRIRKYTRTRMPNDTLF